MKVENMLSPNGNEVPNQFMIWDDEGNVFFQSYSTIIAKDADGVITLDRKMWDYSRTTSKYRNMFVGQDKKNTQRLIKEGVIKLADLNRY